MNAADRSLIDNVRQTFPHRNAAVDYLKIILAVMVVGLHANVFLSAGDTWYWLTNNGLFRIAVPCFFVINGFYFAGTANARAWFARVFRLWVIWSVLYIPFLLTAHHTRTWKFFTFFAGYSHLWYLPAMLMAAGLVQLLRRRSERILGLIAAAAFVMAVVLSLMGQLHPMTTDGLWGVVNDVWTTRNGALFGFPLFTCGFLLSRSGWIDRIGFSTCCWLLLASVVLLLIESHAFHVTSPDRGGVDVYFSILLVGPLVFMTAYKMDLPGPGKTSGKMASGIYFSHFGILIMLNWLGVSGVVSFFATLCASAIAAMVLIWVDRGRLGII